MSQLLKREEAAERLGVEPPTLAKAAQTGQGPLGELPCVKFGRSVRYREEDIESFIAAHTFVPAEQAGGA